MTELGANSPIKQIQIEAVVIRANGDIEDLGVISDSKWHWKPWNKARRAAKQRILAANERMVS